jgi:hypothetical protein
MRALIILLGGLPLSAFLAAGQWINYPDARIPRTKDGKPNLTAPAPRVNGKPDLSGLWEPEPTPVSEFNRVLGEAFTREQVDHDILAKYVYDVFWGLKPDEEPLRPEAVAIMKQPADPNASRCLPDGLPASLFILYFKIVQTPREIVMLMGNGSPPRQIHTDGRALPEDPQPAWMGYSVAKWEGDTLAVDTTGFTEKSPLDFFRHPRSESLHLRERYRRRDFGHLDLELTIDDPKYYTRPYTLRAAFNFAGEDDVLEYVCTENEKDDAHLGKR